MAYDCIYIGGYVRGCDATGYSTTGCQTVSLDNSQSVTMCVCSGNNCNGGSTVASLTGMAFADIVAFVSVARMWLLAD